MRRRRVLAGFAIALPFFAGCNTLIGNDDDGNATTQTRTTAATVGETAQKTATRAVETTSSPTPAPTSTAQSTEAGTAGHPTSTGASSLDLSNLTTYTNDRYSYTIKYPADWKIDDSSPSSVTFTSPRANLSVKTIEDIPGSATLEQITKQLLNGTRQSIQEKDGSVTILNQQKQTLPNGHLGIVIDLRTTVPSGKFRQKITLTSVNGTAYIAHITFRAGDYTTTVEQTAETIVMSVTITDSSD